MVVISIFDLISSQARHLGAVIFKYNKIRYVDPPFFLHLGADPGNILKFICFWPLCPLVAAKQGSLPPNGEAPFYSVYTLAPSDDPRRTFAFTT